MAVPSSYPLTRTDAAAARDTTLGGRCQTNPQCPLLLFWLWLGRVKGFLRLRQEIGRIGVEPLAETGRVVFPVPRFLAVLVEAVARTVLEDPFVDRRFQHVHHSGNHRAASSERPWVLFRVHVELDVGGEPDEMLNPADRIWIAS